MVLCRCQMPSGWAVPRGTPALRVCLPLGNWRRGREERDWLLPSSRPSMEQGRGCRTHQAQELTGILGSRSAEIANVPVVKRLYFNSRDTAEALDQDPSAGTSLPPYAMLVIKKGIKAENQSARFLPGLIFRYRKLLLSKAGSVKAKPLLKDPSAFSGCRPITALTLAVWQCTRRCSSPACLVGAAIARQVTLPHCSLTLLSGFFKERLIKTIFL